MSLYNLLLVMQYMAQKAVDRCHRSLSGWQLSSCQVLQFYGYFNPGSNRCEVLDTAVLRASQLFTGSASLAIARSWHGGYCVAACLAVYAPY